MMWYILEGEATPAFWLCGLRLCLTCDINLAQVQGSPYLNIYFLIAYPP